MFRRLLPGVAALLGVLALASPALAADVPRWCGADRVATDRPDAVAGFQIHVVYAVPPDVPDRFSDVVLPVARELAAIDEWWRAHDPSRAPRFDLFDSPGCDSVFGRLDVSNVRLPNGSGHYAGESRERWLRLREDLSSSAGFSDPDKKYFVFYDGPVGNRRQCGWSAIRPDGERLAFSTVALGSFCAEGLGGGTNAAAIVVHELIHNLGALPEPASGPRPPNACPGDAAHPCDRADDVLSSLVGYGVPLTSLQLDVGGDDYYGHAGPWWDVQDSLFVARLQIADQSPPSGPSSLSVTSNGRAVTLSWPAATDQSQFSYRVYKNGELETQTSEREYADSESIGETVVYGVRAADVHGLLSLRLTVRFKVGFGIVDEAGRVLRDTVPPGGVEPVRVRVRSKRIARLQWSAASDPGGVRGYRVLRNGKLFRTVGARFVDVPRRLEGTWRVQAVDTAGNVGPLSVPVRVR